ncbi:hypothetical protein EMIT0P294_270009 [Pseudomonas sp. IT-P294]
MSLELDIASGLEAPKTSASAFMPDRTGKNGVFPMIELLYSVEVLERLSESAFFELGAGGSSCATRCCDSVTDFVPTGDR